MFVKNNEARVHQIGADTEGRGAITLRPGVNEVDPDDWKRAKQIAVIKHHLKEGTLEEMTKSEASHAAAPAAPLNTTSAPAQRLQDMKVGEAVAVVENTYDRELLNKWKEEGQAKKVDAAIDAQLELIANAGGEAEAQDEAG